MKNLIKLTFLFFSSISCLIVQLDALKQNKFSIIKELPKDTVHFTKAQILHSNDNGLTMKNFEESFDVELSQQILIGQEVFYSKTGDITEFTDERSVAVNMYAEAGCFRNLFHTTNENAVYEFQITVEFLKGLNKQITNKDKLYLKFEELVGADNNPNIVSKTDTTLHSFKKEIMDCIEYSKLSNAIFQGSKYNTKYFKEISEQLISSVVISIIIKLVVVGGSVFVANRSTQIFFRKALKKSRQ